MLRQIITLLVITLGCLHANESLGALENTTESDPTSVNVEPVETGGTLIVLPGVGADTIGKQKENVVEKPVADALVTNTPVPACCGCDSTLVQDRWWYSYSMCTQQKTQISLFANIAGHAVDGSQFSLVTNFANQDINGFQVSGGYNHVNGTIYGPQLSGFVNYAHRVDGLQFAFYVNVADYVDGWQIGELNIADTVKGVQIGTVNISDHIDGVSLGFLTFSDNGLFHLDYSVEESGMHKLTFASGKTLFTSYTLGYTFDSEKNPYLLGFGLGYHKDLGALYWETSLQGNFIMDSETTFSDMDHDSMRERERWDGRYNTSALLNIRIGTQPWSSLGVFAGLNYTFLDTQGNAQLMGPWTSEFSREYGDMRYWPGFEVGVRFGR